MIRGKAFLTLCQNVKNSKWTAQTTQAKAYFVRNGSWEKLSVGARKGWARGLATSPYKRTKAISGGISVGSETTGPGQGSEMIGCWGSHLAARG